MFKILIVENCKFWVDYFKLGMENRAVALDICWVCSGEKALELLASEASFDVILMNLEMPKGMDGIETTMKIRAMGKRLPIIAWTSHLASYKKQACYEAGMNDYVERDGTSMIKDIFLALQRCGMVKK